jgi:predicted DNA-binding antitoxin AbrB/MazE fold protein
MSELPRQIEAIYEDGVLRPLQPLNLKEHEHVVVSVFPAAHPPSPTGLDVEYLEKIRKEVESQEPAPGWEEVRRRLAKIPGSMADEIVKERRDR